MDIEPKKIKMGGLFIKFITWLVAAVYLKNPSLHRIIYVKHPTLKSVFTSCVNEIAFILRTKRSPFLKAVVLELTNHCNLKCSMCPNNTDMKRKRGYMSLELFKKVIDEAQKLDFVQFHCWGEPLLHPRFLDMLSYAKGKGIFCHVITNGILLTPELSSKLIRGGLDRIMFSMDGVGETYRRIRGVDYGILKKNIDEFLAIKSKEKSGIIVELSIVDFDDTEDGIVDVERDWGGKVSAININPLFKHREQKRTAPCRELWRGNLNVLWNGDVVPCCVDYDGTLVLGNVANERLTEIWNGKIIRTLRMAHKRRDFSGVCANCWEYSSKKIKPRFR